MSPEQIPLIGRKTDNPITFDFTAITGILTAVTMFAFVLSVHFVEGVGMGIGLDLALYMQPLDYVVITPYWIALVVYALFLVIAMIYYRCVFLNRESPIYRGIKRRIDLIYNFNQTEVSLKRTGLLLPIVVA
jgi:hypothetical protein